MDSILAGKWGGAETVVQLRAKGQRASIASASALPEMIEGTDLHWCKPLKWSIIRKSYFDHLSAHLPAA